MIPNKKTVSTYLRSFNVFVSDSDNNKLTLVVPEIVSAVLIKSSFEKSFEHLFIFKYGNHPNLFEFALGEAALVHQYMQRFELNPLVFPHLIPKSGISLIKI